MPKLPSEKIIVDGLKRDDAGILRLLFDRYYEELVHFSFRLIHKQEIAEELVSDVFEKLWLRRKELEIKNSISTYLYTAVKYQSINFLKSRINDFKPTDNPVVFESTVEETPYEKLSLQDLEKAIQKAIEELPEQCRIIFLLSRSEEFTNKEIAKQLEISDKTVENQITIALKRIRTFLNKNWYVFFLSGVWGVIIFHLTNK